MLFECASHQFDRLKHHKHHWIEEGTYDDFKECILTSDLPFLIVAMMGSGYNGAPSWCALQGVDLAQPGADHAVALMGTVVVQPGAPMWRALQGAADRVYVQADFARIERTVIEMLTNRPEVKKHEPKAKAPVAAAR